MSRVIFFTIAIFLAISAIFNMACFAAIPPVMSYQGKLTNTGEQAVTDGSYGFLFEIYDQESGGNQLWSEVQDVQITGGLFTVLLGSVTPLPGTACQGEAWLQISVNHEQMGDRVRIASAPSALRAGLAETVPDNSITTDKVADDSVTAPKLGEDAASLAKVSGGVMTSFEGKIGIGTTNPIAALDVIGMVNTTEVGTMDNQAFTLRVNNSRAFLIEPTTGAPNVIGGPFSNYAIALSVGAAISGGESNVVDGQFTSILGGHMNQARVYASTVGGGESNIATNYFATVPGGASNSATGNYSFAAGRRAKAIHQGSFVWADSTNADQESEAQDQFLVRASGGAKIVGDLHVTGKISSDPGKPSTPIAYGNVSLGGSWYGGTSNWTSQYVSASGYYEITITGEWWDWYHYIMVVTPVSSGPRFATTWNYGSGKFLVYIWDLSGTKKMDTSFHFVVYKQ